MDVKIEIENNRWTTRQYLRRLGFATGTVILPIGLGVVVGSPAMQWAGFVMAMIILLAIGKVTKTERTFTVHSFVEARRVIDVFEKTEAAETRGTRRPIPPERPNDGIRL